MIEHRILNNLSLGVLPSIKVLFKYSQLCSKSTFAN